MRNAPSQSCQSWRAAQAWPTNTAKQPLAPIAD
jgi:hypothetical protein